MPASLPGSTLVENHANPDAGQFVIFDLLSGPKGSPLDVRSIAYDGQDQVYTPDADNQTPSTGALSTGIGFGANHVIDVGGIRAAGFTDNYVPGVTKPDGLTLLHAIMVYIGGGRSTAAGVADPYTAGVGIGGAGNGGSRDAGLGPAFTGFIMNMVTAAAEVDNGEVVETGYVNRSGVTLAIGQSTFGSATAASAAPI